MHCSQNSLSCAALENLSLANNPGGVCLSVCLSYSSWDETTQCGSVPPAFPSLCAHLKGAGFGFGSPSTAHISLPGSAEERNSSSFYIKANLTRFSPLCTFALLSGVIFIALELCLQAQMVPKMNKSKPHSSRPGSSYIKVLQFG